MSWAAHNPEKYDEILRAGVVDKIEAAMRDEGFEFDYDTVCMVVETLQNQASGPTTHNPWDQLVSWASKQVAAAEGDYFSSLVP
jgi:hypothetical protein